MIGSGAFNYINVLDKAADAIWIRNTIINNNIANVDTPGFKRRDVQFESYLRNAMAGGPSLDYNVNHVDLSTLEATTYIDQSSLSYRLDGNNVDIDTETAQLAETQLKYYIAIDSINHEFNRIKIALTTK